MKLRPYPLLLLASVLLTGTASLVVADNLNMPAADHGKTCSVTGPKHGMSKEQVEASFGQPDSRNGPTGDPPIYFWEYPAFTVYFESDYVIHTVCKQYEDE